MVGGREGEKVSKELSKLFDEKGSKLGTLVRDNLVVEFKSEVDFIVKKLCNVKGRS